jgi:hypothetical protein
MKQAFIASAFNSKTKSQLSNRFEIAFPPQPALKIARCGQDMNLDAAAIRLGHKVLSYRINQSLRNSTADYLKKSARRGQHTNRSAAGVLAFISISGFS